MMTIVMGENPRNKGKSDHLRVEPTDKSFYLSIGLAQAERKEGKK